MLLSASDWQFLISTFAARDYAELRLDEQYHASNPSLLEIADSMADESISDQIITVNNIYKQ